MKFKKQPYTREEWIVEIAGRDIPLEAFRQGIQTIFICVLAYMTYTIGILNASELIKWAEFFGKGCQITQVGTHLTFTDCIDPGSYKEIPQQNKTVNVTGN